MEYEDVWQGPQAELDAALLELLAVRAAPGVIRSQLQSMVNTEHTLQYLDSAHVTLDFRHFNHHCFNF